MELLLFLTIRGAAILIAGFLAVIVWQFLSGRISTDGLLDSKEAAAAGTTSAARVQMLIVTVVVAGRYVLAVIQNPDRNTLPGLPTELIAALGASQAVYLGGKAWTTFLPLIKRIK